MNIKVTIYVRIKHNKWNIIHTCVISNDNFNVQ